MPVTGDFKALDHWVKTLRDLGHDTLPKMSAAMAEEALNLIAEGFDRGSDPYGKPWNAPNNLQITGRLRAFGKKQVSARGFVVGATDRKAIWHHAPRPRPKWGGKSLPQRLQVPIKSRGLPKHWAKQLKEAATEEFLDAFGKKSKKKAKKRTAASSGNGFVAHKLRGVKRRFSAQAIARRVLKAIRGQ